MKRALFFAWVIVLSFPSFSKEDVYVELILDGSGSMQAPMGEQTRMQVAKLALSKYLNQANQDHYLGLRVYGHRQKGDCNDSTLLVPIEQKNRQHILSTIDAIEPLSMTPISYSLEQATEDLKSFKGIRGIVLVTDGEESCNRNPCEVAKSIHKHYHDIKVNVIGFNIEEQAAKDQLQCIAKATGGTYVDAKDVDKLYQGIKESVEKVTGGTLKINTLSDLSFVVTITDTKGKVFFKDAYPIKQFVLPPGTYTVQLKSSEGIAENTILWTDKNIKVRHNELTTVWMKGYGSLTVNTHPLGLVCTVKFYNQKTDRKIREGYTSGWHLIPVGTYRAEITNTRSGKKFVLKDLNVSENQRTTVPLDCKN